jgi:hypothetical protein
METTARTNMSILQAANAATAGERFQENEWGKRHASAWRDALLFHGNRKPSHAAALALMITGWAMYADSSEQNFGYVIKDDGHLGPPWAAIGQALQRLLDGDTGALDCGTLCNDILGAIRENVGLDDNWDD